MFKKKRNIFWKIIISLLLILIVAWGYYIYIKYYTQPSSILTNTVQDQKKQTSQDIIQKVGELILLPTGETPTLATILEKEKLQDQEFFKNAENGDQLLAFSQSKLAILYRPSIHKLIEVAPLLINQKQEKVSDTTTSSTPVSTTGSSEPSSTASENTPSQKTSSLTPSTVAIYNGTAIQGLAASLAKTIEKSDLFTVVTKTNAVNDYTSTIVVDVSGTHGEEVRQLAQIYSATVAEFPKGEKKPSADILLIAGKDQKVQ